MEHHDQSLKQAIQSDQPPPLPPHFTEQTLRRAGFAAGTTQGGVVGQGQAALGLDRFITPQRLLLAMVVLACAWLLQYQLSVSADEELMRIDTLSLFSLSVL